MTREIVRAENARGTFVLCLQTPACSGMAAMSTASSAVSITLYREHGRTAVGDAVVKLGIGLTGRGLVARTNRPRVYFVTRCERPLDGVLNWGNRCGPS